MATWRAIIQKVIKDPDATVIEVLFTDDSTQKVMREYRLTDSNLDAFKRTIQNQINQYGQADQTKLSIVPGDFDPTITPPAPTPRDIYATNLTLFEQMNRAIAAGVKTNQDSDFVTLQKTIRDTFDPTYIDLF